MFRHFLEMSFCALSYGQREEQYLQCIERFKSNREVLNLYVQAFSQMVVDYEKGIPFSDHLGDYHMGLMSSKEAQSRGEFYTPMPVCEFMAEVTRSNKSDQPITLHEPAAGSGRMVLASAKALVKDGGSPMDMWVEAWDVGVLPFWMCFINLSLWGIPARVVRGNTLSLKIFDEQFTATTFFRPPPQVNKEWAQKVNFMRQLIRGEIPEARLEPVKVQTPQPTKAQPQKVEQPFLFGSSVPES
ncbi:MAG: N-6 DNA methylase [Deinococcota bacterium]